jgi:nicotinamide phosphoribosyltransferase
MYQTQPRSGRVNFCLATDSYKHSHWKMYPDGTEKVVLYLEHRGFKYPDGVSTGRVVEFALEAILRDYLEGVVLTKEMVEKARKTLAAHFGNDDVFNYEGFMYIVEQYGGKLPISIRAVAEGTPVEIHNAVLIVESLDPKLFWLPGFVEGQLLHLWATSNVATYSRECKKLILKYAELTGSPKEAVDFMLHDFGFRGVSSYESAAYLGAAHLVNFLGTDTLPGLELTQDVYDDGTGFSVPAAEHSPVTSWGRDHEFDAFRNILRNFPNGIVSVISDSWDVFNATENGWAGELKADVLKRDGKVVIRPDSGDPVEVNRKLLNILWTKFGGTINDKGFKVLDSHVGIIQGDGIDYGMINAILAMCVEEGFAAHNMVFGSGGGLLQKHNRDELGSAIKNCYTVVNGEGREVYKDPITSPGKTSKRGYPRLLLEDGKYVTVTDSDIDYSRPSLLQEVFNTGEVLVHSTMSEVRERARITDEELAAFVIPAVTRK